MSSLFPAVVSTILLTIVTMSASAHGSPPGTDSEASLQAQDLSGIDTTADGLVPPPSALTDSGPTAADQDPEVTSQMDPDLQMNLSTQSLQLKSDTQSFNQITEVFEATGNVEMRFGRTILRADRMTIAIPTQQVIAEGTVQVELGDQRVEGDRLEYNFQTEQGVLSPASGQVDIRNLPADSASTGLGNDLLSGSSARNQDPDRPESRFVRFEAEQITFDASSWQGVNVRVTNDPFDPPELEVRSPMVRSELQADGSSRVIIEPGQLAFDQVFFLPLPIRFQLDEFEEQTPISIYVDNFDREEIRRGLIIQPNFELLDRPNLNFVVSPQLYPQRLADGVNGLSDAVGLQTRLQVVHPKGQTTTVLAELRGLVFEELADRLLGKVEHVIPTGDGGSVRYSYGYRERFFSGLLGFQTVQNRLGARYNSPVLALGNSGVEFSYRVALDLIDALGQDPIDEEAARADETSDQELQLARVQLGTALSRSFPLWQPEVETGPLLVGDVGLESAPPQLRFSPSPIQQGLWLNTGFSSNQALYSNGETQSYLSGSIGVDAVLGKFVKDTFDYTNVNVVYSNGFLAGASPFLFDRITTREQLYLGFLQQLYGPIRVGARTTIDLQSGERVDTTYTVGYDRRTYGFSLRYNPVLETGAVELRVDSFNWEADPVNFTEVTGGIERD